MADTPGMVPDVSEGSRWLGWIGRKLISSNSGVIGLDGFAEDKIYYLEVGSGLLGGGKQGTVNCGWLGMVCLDGKIIRCVFYADYSIGWWKDR